MDCPYCGNPLTRYDKTCPECGLQLPQLRESTPAQTPAEPVAAPVCPECGSPLDPVNGLCPGCTAKALPEEAAETPVCAKPDPVVPAEPACPVAEAAPSPTAMPEPAPAAEFPAPLPDESDGPNPWLLLALGVFVWPAALILFFVLKNKHKWAGFELLSYAICGSVGMVLCFIGLWLPGLLAPAAGLVAWNFIASRKA